LGPRNTKRLDVRIAVAYDVEDGVSETEVSAVFGFGSTFKEGDACAGFVGGGSYYEPGITAADDYYVAYVEGVGLGDGTICDDGIGPPERIIRL
jgi:hypothetical protein